MERSEFAEKVLAELRRAEPNVDFALEEDEFRIRHKRPDGTTALIMLHNHYDVHEHAAPAARAEIFARIVTASRAVDSQETLGEVRSLLVPRIRPRRHFEVDVKRAAASIDGAAKANPFAYLPLAEHLGVALAIDRPQQIEYVTDGVGRFGLPLEELHEIALVNLRRMTKKGLDAAGPGVWMGMWGDDYAAERILLPELWKALETKGSPVVFMPGPEVIFVADSANAKALAVVMELVEQRVTEPRAILDFAFVWKDGAWSLFEPGGEVGERLGGGLALHLADAYAAQKAALEENPIGEEFVASVMGMGKDGKVSTTAATWGKDVPTLLPRVQMLAILEEMTPGSAIMASWDDVLSLAGAYLEKVPDLYPPRWRTKSFPDAATLAKLRARPPKMPAAPGKKAPSAAAAPAPARGGTGRLVLMIGVALVVASILYAFR